MHIYAPLANRLGIWQLKWELEDLAFRFLDPPNYRKIAQSLAERRTERARRIEDAARRLQDRLDENGLIAEVSGRPKHIYSIYRKMERKRAAFEHIYDVQALRVIVDPSDSARLCEEKATRKRPRSTARLCYQVLGAVHSLWQPIPQEFDDYIASQSPMAINRCTRPLSTPAPAKPWKSRSAPSACTKTLKKESPPIGPTKKAARESAPPCSAAFKASATY